MNQPTTLDLTGGWENIVNRHHACVAAVDRISKNLDCDMLARKLNAISAGRRREGKR